MSNQRGGSRAIVPRIFLTFALEVNGTANGSCARRNSGGSGSAERLQSSSNGPNRVTPQTGRPQEPPLWESKGFRKTCPECTNHWLPSRAILGQKFDNKWLTYLLPMPVPQRLKCEHLAGQEWAIRKATITEHNCGHSFYTLHHATVIFSFAESESLQKPFQRSVSELCGALSGGLHIPAATGQFDCAKLTDSIPK